MTETETVDVDDQDLECLPNEAAAAGQEPVLERIAKELFRLHASQATGDLAGLRRMDRHALPPAAFYRLLARAGMSELSPQSVPRWKAAVHIMAQRPDALRASGLGKALAEIGVSETRLDMLLYARDTTLIDLARRTAIRLAKSRETLPYSELCHLVLDDDRAEKNQQADAVRIRIAQSYQHERRKQDAA